MLLTHQLTIGTAEKPEYIGAYVCELRVRIDGVMARRYLWADGNWGVYQYPFPDEGAVNAALQRQQPQDGIKLTPAEILVATVINEAAVKRRRS